MSARGQKRTNLDSGRIRGLIFDCDGVLFDTRDVNRHYYNHIRTALDLPPMTQEEEDYSFMHTVAATLQHILPAPLLPQAQAIQARMTYAAFIERMIPEPGLLELLTQLEDLGVRMAVNTNRTNSMEMVLERFGLTRFFYPVMTAAKVTRPKPDPEGLLRIVQDWNLPRAQLAYLGDSVVDQETADRAGVSFWAYRNPDLTAQLHVDSFHELRQSFATGGHGKTD